MILQPVKNVELTKVHYYDQQKYHRNAQIHSISREVYENSYNKNVIIKKNIFGHRWVLKINEDNDTAASKKKTRVKVVLYVLVFVCIIIAVFAGLFFTLGLEKKFFSSICNKTVPMNVEPNNSDVSLTLSSLEHETLRISTEQLEDFDSEIDNKTIVPELTSDMERSYCTNCKQDEICLKIEETEDPRCVKAKDLDDPTGCGGLCLINVQFCALLDSKRQLVQCIELKSILKCPPGTFNCGNQCIAQNKKCDGIIHCSNNSDEKDCECDLRNHFQCENSTSCFTLDRKCDGIVDCLDKSDETNCKKVCAVDEYHCINGQCISKDYFCDGKKQCSDGSDEAKGCEL